MLRFKKLGIMTAFLGLMLALGPSAQAQILGTGSTNDDGIPTVAITTETIVNTPTSDVVRITVGARDFDGEVLWVRIIMDGQFVAGAVGDLCSTVYEVTSGSMITAVAMDNDGNMGSISRKIMNLN